VLPACCWLVFGRRLVGLSSYEFEITKKKSAKFYIARMLHWPWASVVCCTYSNQMGRNDSNSLYGERKKDLKHAQIEKRWNGLEVKRARADDQPCCFSREAKRGSL
jgi:hypothetical protein